MKENENEIKNVENSIIKYWIHSFPRQAENLSVAEL